MRRLDPDTTALLSRELEGEDRLALPFVQAVVIQLAHPVGAEGIPERQITERVLHLLHHSGGAAAELSSSPALLSAFFQNIDLLYENSYSRADELSLLVMEALQLAGEGG